MIADPDAIVDIELLSPEDGGRRTPIAADSYGCPIRFEDEYFDCRMDLSGVGALPPGGGARVPLKFLNPDLIVPRLEPGSKFTLWEGKTIGQGKVVALLRGVV
ncbi:MAG TPA: hypothetical protein VLV78_13955 [Thermoanaerobaculia bacterium]|nr:hypothetical protein [Thermoanaerobaculia bacterium]